MTKTRRRWSAALSKAALGVLVSGCLAVPAASAERLTDKDVKNLLEKIDQERDRFEDQLDGTLKRSILRGPGGEVNVERYLDDLQENVDRLKERFTPQYAASAEATTVLRQGADIQRFMSTQPANLDGASEWNRLSSSLGALAAAYGSIFPLADGAQARRLNDREVRKSAEALAKGADRFKKDLDAALKKDKTVDKAARESAVMQADDLKRDAQTLASTIGDERPASGEAQALLQRAATIRAAAAAKPRPPAAMTAWGLVEAELGKIAQAFSLPVRVP